MKNILLIILLTISTLSAKTGASIYKKHCSSCHGKYGEKKAIGRSAIISKQSYKRSLKQLRAYKAGTLNLHGMGAVMKKNVANLTDADIKKVAKYISHLSK